MASIEYALYFEKCHLHTTIGAVNDRDGLYAISV